MDASHHHCIHPRTVTTPELRKDGVTEMLSALVAGRVYAQ